MPASVWIIGERPRLTISVPMVFGTLSRSQRLQVHAALVFRGIPRSAVAKIDYLCFVNVLALGNLYLVKPLLSVFSRLKGLRSSPMAGICAARTSPSVLVTTLPVCIEVEEMSR